MDPQLKRGFVEACVLAAVREQESYGYLIIRDVPEELGLTRCEKQDLLGGTPEENAATVRAILGGEEQGPKRDAAVYNAAAALYITGKAQTLQEGATMAAEVLQKLRVDGTVGEAYYCTSFEEVNTLLP